MNSTNRSFKAFYTPNPASLMLPCFGGALASLLAGDEAAYRSLASRVYNCFCEKPDGENARIVLEIDGLVPNTLSNLTKYLPLAELVRTNTSSGQCDQINSVALGIFEFRCGRWDDALKWLDAARRGGYPGIASQAGYFTAMLHHFRGEPERARTALAEATRRFDAFVRSWSGAESWFSYRAAIARAEAERLILGQQCFEFLNPTTFEVVRRAWAPVPKRLNEAEGFASQGKWSEARDAYLRAMAEPNFDWDSAETGDGVETRGVLGLKFGAVLLRAQDWPHFRQLCQRLTAYWEATLSDPALGRGYAPLFLIATNEVSPELVQKAIGWARLSPAELNRFNKAAGRPGDPTRGIAAYRAGEYEEALRVLSAESRDSAVADAGTALAFRAMSLYQLGRQTEARGSLGQAENLLAKPLKDLSGDEWYRLALAQTALEEAQTLIRQNDRPRAASK